jgi:crotonobetainyl-CoA:carnitine CoA-transferase CaiB-like acyl-CoA transferase
MREERSVGNGLFSDLKVIDCASWIAGPAAATILSDFGADVIKIEPLGGDPWRGRGANPHTKTDHYWQLTARNKRSLAIDLKHATGRDVLYRLASKADVFVTNFPLPVRERLKLTPDDLLPSNQRLIYASFTAYGEAGDEAAKTGFDSTAYWARTGLMDAVRADVDTPPSRSAPGMGDHPSATGLFAGIVCALYRREKTGRGGVVSSSLLANGLWANGCFVQTRLGGDLVPHRPPREQAPNALANHYRGRDGRWFIMALFNEEKQLRSLLAAIGREDLASDPRFATKEVRAKNAHALVAELDAVFGQRDVAEWRGILDSVGVTFGIAARTDDVMEDAQMRAIGALVPWADGDGLTVSSPFNVEGEVKTAPRHAPALGQHSEDVLREAGYSADEIGEMRAKGIV